MKIDGNLVYLDGNELALAVDAYLVAHRVAVIGPRTIRIGIDGIGIDGERYLCRDVDLSVVGERIVDNRSSIPVESAR